MYRRGLQTLDFGRSSCRPAPSGGTTLKLQDRRPWTVDRRPWAVTVTVTVWSRSRSRLMILHIFGCDSLRASSSSAIDPHPPTPSPGRERGRSISVKHHGRGEVSSLGSHLIASDDCRASDRPSSSGRGEGGEGNSSGSNDSAHRVDTSRSHAEGSTGLPQDVINHERSRSRSRSTEHGARSRNTEHGARNP